MSDMMEAYRVNHGAPPLPSIRAEPPPPEPGAGDVYDAAQRVALVDNSDWHERLQAREYYPIVKAINQYRAQKGLKGFYFTPEQGIRNGIDVSGFNNAYGVAAQLRGSSDSNEAEIWQELGRIRGERPDFLRDAAKSQDEFWQKIYAREGEKRKADQALLGRSRGFVAGAAEFAGGMEAGLEDPLTIMTLPVGGIGKNFAMRIATEALANSGVEALLQPQVARNRAKLGEAMTTGDQLRNIGFAGAGGAAFQSIGEAGGFLLKKVLAGTAAPDEKAALHILEREQSIDATNPHIPGHEGEAVHRSKMADAQLGLVHPELARPSVVPRQNGGALAPDIVQFFRGKGYSEAQARGIAAGIEAESRSDHSIRGGYKGRALGLGQWLGDRRAEVIRRYGENPTRQQQLEFIHEELQGRDGGGKSVLSGADEADVLRRYISDFMRPAKGAQTSGDLQRGMAALGRSGETIAPSGTSPLSNLDIASDAPPVRPEALDAVRPIVTAGTRSLDVMSFAPEDIGVDAALMQFKSGGDARGVTDRLHGVQEWDPLAAGTVTVWEGNDGRRLIADGHQRLGLATRIKAENPSADIRLNAFVLREADGISAQTARLITARKNIGEGTGTILNAAKVFREAEDDAEAILRTLPPRSALVRDGRDVFKLSDDAFGAVVNEVIPADYGAVIGRFAPDKKTHGALVDLLAKVQPANRKQAEGVVRQALLAGFSRETQEELFGARAMTSALFLQRAKILDKTLGELRKLKGAFSVAARNKDALEGAGNVIAVDASEAAARANAAALGIVEKLAYSKGHVADILNAAAERIAKGEPIGRVVSDVVADIRTLDLQTLARGSDDNRGAGGSAGRSGLDEFNDDADAGARPADELEPPRDYGGLTADERASVDFEEPSLSLFDDIAGSGAKAQADGLTHDVAARIDEGAFDGLDFAASSDRPVQSAALIKASLDAEDTALKAIRECL
jgi:Phage tail lysozyme